MAVRWKSTVALDIGGRKVQQDSAVAFVSNDRRIAFAVVADGLGGHGDGELASGLVVACAERLWAERRAGRDDLRGATKEMVELANTAIVDLQTQRGVDSRSTVCCVVGRDGEIEIASVGDSRAYLLADGTLERLTRDHSVTEMLLASDEISEEAMRGHPDSSRLTQSLGTTDALRPFVVDSRHLRAGQSLLLCSDGLWQALPADEIAAALDAGDDGRLEGLVSRAAAAAGEQGDNICAVLLEVEGDVGRRKGGGLVSWFRQ